MEELIEEVIEDFNIPPYFPKSTLDRIGKEGLAYFEQLNNGCSVNLESDFNFRTLLKNSSLISFYLHCTVGMVDSVLTIELMIECWSNSQLSCFSSESLVAFWKWSD